MLDTLELQLASAVQRFNALQRRAGTARDSNGLLTRALAELGTALEEIRVAQEQIVANRTRIEQMQEDLRRQSERYWKLFDEIPQPYVVTRADSVILEVNQAAAELLNVSQRFLVGKLLSVFVCEDRGGFLHRAGQLAAQKATDQFEFKLRPRERAPQTVSARVSADEENVRWLLRPKVEAVSHADTPVARP